MKKLACIILLIQCGFVMAQTKTLVTMYGEKVQITPNSLATANNGLTTSNGNVQLGGILTEPTTTLVTSSSNTFAISGLQNSLSSTDNLVVADPTTGILKTLNPLALNNGWLLKGNSGTTASTTSSTSNFIGTTDDTAINFRVNNKHAGWIGNESSSSSVYFGLNSGLASAGKPSSGAANVGIGANALQFNTSNGNTAIGAGSLQSSKSGYNNVAVGLYSLSSNDSGIENTAIGSGALGANTSGKSNSAFGLNAGTNNITGSNNTFIGPNTNLTGYALVVSNATAIGFNAKVGASNSLVLGGTGADAVKVGIGNTTPTNTLHVTTTANPVRFEGLQQTTTMATDLSVVTDAYGVLKTNDMAFSAKTPLVITSTGTAPTKANLPQNNFIRYRLLPNHELEVDFLYTVFNGTGGTAGTGDYLFALPAGYGIDYNEHSTNTSPANTGLPYMAIARDCGAVFATTADDTNRATGCYISFYDPTHFRIIGTFTTQGSAAVGSTTVPLSSSVVMIGGRFKIKWDLPSAPTH